MDKYTISIKRIGILIGALFLVSAAHTKLHAQSFQVSGKVLTAESEEPLPGVNILEVGTQNGNAENYKATISRQGPDEFTTHGWWETE